MDKFEITKPGYYETREGSTVKILAITEEGIAIAKWDGDYMYWHASDGTFLKNEPKFDIVGG